MTADFIIRSICEVFGLEEDQLRSGRKTYRWSHPRQLAMVLIYRECLDMRVTAIAKFFGLKHHASVCSAQRITDRLLFSSPDFKAKTVEVISRIKKNKALIKALKEGMK